MRMVIALAVSLAFLVSPSLADTVRLTDGTVLRGKIKGNSATKVILEYEKGKFKTIERAEIEAIEKDDFEFPSPAPPPKKAEPAKPPTQPTGKMGQETNRVVNGNGGNPEENGSVRYDPEFANAMVGNACEAIAKQEKIRELTGREFGKLQMLQIMELPAARFIRKDGKLNKDADKEAFRTAIDNITPAKIQTATALIVGTIDNPKVYEFIILLAASGAFVYEKGKVNTEAFDAALSNITAAQVKKTKGLVNYKEDSNSEEGGPSEPLYLLLRASAHFVNKNGKFDKDVLNTALEAVTPERITAKMKEMKDPNINAAFDELLRPPTP